MTNWIRRHRTSRTALCLALGLTLALGAALGLTPVALVFWQAPHGALEWALVCLLGLVGGTAYVMARKGKEVELPAQTAFLVRMDTSVTLPVAAANTTSYGPGTR